MLSAFGLFDRIDSAGTNYIIDEQHIIGAISGTDSLMHGVSNFYELTIDGDTKLYSTKEFNNGIQIGEYKTYYENGQVSLVGQYSPSGLATGVWYTFWPNGTIGQVFSYSNGKLNGVYYHYDETGKLFLKERYEDDILLESQDY